MANTREENERTNLQFPKAVRLAFKFLVEDFFFSLIKEDVTYVRYESKTVFVNVYHGRASYELNVEIGERVIDDPRRENPFTIGEILQLVNPQQYQVYRPYQATTSESVKKFLYELAHLVREYARPALLGDEEFFQQVHETRHQNSNKLLLSWELNRIRRDVEIAWREKNFKRVVEIYNPVKEHLTPAEMKKLEYARKKVEVN